jgi:hypothetical protein
MKTFLNECRPKPDQHPAGKAALDLFNKPAGYRTGPCEKLRILPLLTESCSETLVSEQLYCMSPVIMLHSNKSEVKA